MIAKFWKLGMLTALLGLGCVVGSSASALADPPRGSAYGGRSYSYGRSGVVIRNDVHHLRTYPRSQPRYGYHDHYHQHHYDDHPTWSHRPSYDCYPHPYQGVPRSNYYPNYYRPTVPRIGISVGGWPSGPSFGGGGFPYGSPYGRGVNVQVGR